MKRTATIILNRNLPRVTERLYESIENNNAAETDIYVVEAGSQKNNLSRYCTWWANWDESIEHGLRVPRGFNYGLCKLWEDKRFSQYDFFFLLPNDTEFRDEPIIETLVCEMENHPRVGILSPCSKHWGEKKLFNGQKTKYFWYINHIAWLLRREFIESIMELESPTYMNFLYDGENFRGYESDIELIVKGYANDWAAAITTRVIAEENEEHLKTKADLIKTEPYVENLIKVLDEGKKWLRRKYGFNSRWTMQIYAKFFYDKFFEFYPELVKYKI
ncbi:MAG TPA: hypothetical protein VJ201_02050 [Candidatus Babeliales bacterium]|nr:hypothetical protein [Candidatus Babeliales bacterium]